MTINKPHMLMMTAAIAALAATVMTAGPSRAQTVSDDEVPDVALKLPNNLQLYGDRRANVYRPSATVNGEIITATDIEQRMALIRIANRNITLSPEEDQRLRQQLFNNLVDEKLQIQEAVANKIDIEEAQIDQQFARFAAQFRQTADEFSKYLLTQGSSATAVKQQIRGEFAWERLLSRNIRSTTNVSTEEVAAQGERQLAARGTDEFHLGEIYLSATPENAAAVQQNASRIIESLQRGGSFPAFARQFSEASTAVVGGDLGWVRGGQIPETMAAAATQMQPGQLVGPLEVPGGYSILVMIDRRQVLTANPRDAVLSLKQVALDFPAGISEAEATRLAGRFADETRKIAGCGMADSVAQQLGATVVARDAVPMRSLPAPLQSTLATLQVGQTTQPFGSPSEGVSVLVLCGRDIPNIALAPNLQEIENRLLEEKVNRRAQRYLRDLRRDAVIEYTT